MFSKSKSVPWRICIDIFLMKIGKYTILLAWITLLFLKLKKKKKKGFRKCEGKKGKEIKWKLKNEIYLHRTQIHKRIFCTSERKKMKKDENLETKHGIVLLKIINKMIKCLNLFEFFHTF